MPVALKFMRQIAPRLTFNSVAAGSIFVALGWVFWPTLVVMADRWGNDPRYSHGYLVPVFSIYLLWSRRRGFDFAACHPSWLGLLLLLTGLALRFAGIYFYVEWFAAVALLPCLAGFALATGGRAAFRWSWSAIAFLIFMAPLPFRLEVALAHPLQRIATMASTFALQTCGFVTIAEGNTIRMRDVRLGVVEACSGLSMLVVFFALSSAVAIVIRRPWYEKVVVFISAIPIALVANIARITVTGVLHKTVGREIAVYVYHDLAGWLMMPLALALVWLELRLMAWLVKDRPLDENFPMHVTSTVDAAPISEAADRPAQEGPVFVIQPNFEGTPVFVSAPLRDDESFQLDFGPPTTDAMQVEGHSRQEDPPFRIESTADFTPPFSLGPERDDETLQFDIGLPAADAPDPKRESKPPGPKP